jgi:hypothetical protein
MPPNGLVALMVNGPGLENRFGRAEYVFDRPEIFIDVSYCLGVVNRIGAQNPQPSFDTLATAGGKSPLADGGRGRLAVSLWRKEPVLS